ncbi:MAG: hypothetical protein LBL74_02300 [Bacteroidales bacterium]|nr:hypothetical protein [Bacteroidales bacterium]
MRTQQNIMKKNRTETPQKSIADQIVCCENKVVSSAYLITAASLCVMCLRT